MIENHSEVPIACSLSAAELKQRQGQLLARFRSAVIATEELPDGYSFRMAGDRDCIALIAELIVAERECCPFLAFEIFVYPEQAPVTVRILGPSGASGFLRTIFFNPEVPA